MTLGGGSGQINTLKGSLLRTVDIFTAGGPLNASQSCLADREVLLRVKGVDGNGQVSALFFFSLFITSLT